MAKSCRTLSPIRAAFVRHYTGNCAETVRLMAETGYSLHEETARRWLKQPAMQSAIWDRDTDGQGVMTRDDRLKFWAKMAAGDISRNVQLPNGEVVEVGPDYKERMKASELLGRANGDFIERVELSGELTMGGVLGEYYERKDKGILPGEKQPVRSSLLE